MKSGKSVALVIPALNEEATIGSVLAEVDRSLVDRIVVGDNGSSDRTAELAAEAGAIVVSEPRRGYGSACLAALRRARDVDIVAFMDADGSDDPGQLDAILTPIASGDAQLVIGSRTRGGAEPGALTPVQHFGNALTCTLVRWFWGVRYTDLGPFRAISRPALDALNMRDPDFGWTIEMQVKAARHAYAVREVPVRCRVRRGGRSKVSGTVMGSLRAGTRILAVVLGTKLRELRSGNPAVAGRSR